MAMERYSKRCKVGVVRSNPRPGASPVKKLRVEAVHEELHNSRARDEEEQEGFRIRDIHQEIDEEVERIHNFMVFEERSPVIPGEKLGLRKQLAEFMEKITLQELLDCETFHLGLAYLDACISSQSFVDEELEGVAGTCLFLAIKFEDLRYRRRVEFRPETYKFEVRVLKVLQHKLMIPTVAFFAHKILHCLGVELEASELAGLAEYNCSDLVKNQTNFLPSLGAAAVVFQSVEACVVERCEQEKFFTRVVEITGHSREQIISSLEQASPGAFDLNKASNNEQDPGAFDLNKPADVSNNEQAPGAFDLNKPADVVSNNEQAPGTFDLNEPADGSNSEQEESSTRLDSGANTSSSRCFFDLNEPLLSDTEEFIASGCEQAESFFNFLQVEEATAGNSSRYPMSFRLNDFYSGANALQPRCSSRMVPAMTSNKILC